MNTELPEPWKTAAEQKGLSSFRAIHRASGLSVETVRKVITGTRRPNPDTAGKLAAALGVNASQVDRWVGIGGDEDQAGPYSPPTEAQRLTRRQRRAVDEIIRAMIEPVGIRGPADISWNKSGFDLAAMSGESEGKRSARDYEELGEETQESPRHD